MNKLKRFMGNLRTSFWFVPSLIVGASVVLALILIEVDALVSKEWLTRLSFLFGTNAVGARGMLTTIAGSMMSVVGVTFSMTLVTLALASSQYTSRILRNFMRDGITQVVLGIFAGIFTYCLIVLRTIRGGESVFVPSLAVFFGMLLAIGGIVVLIFFIHHIASSIQASSIIASVAEETLATVDKLFPGALGEEPVEDDADQARLLLPERSWQTVPAKGNGYIQSVDNEALLRLADENKLIVRMERGIGMFVVHGTALASLSLDEPPGEEIIAALQNAYSISRHRTPEQDTAFGLRQIVDMALRALSPSINDTTTAVMCIDYLTAILARLAVRSIPSAYRFEAGELRVIAIGPSFASLVAESFDQIRGSAQGNLAVLLRMLGALQTIASLTASVGRRQVLREEMACIAELAARTIQSPHDRARFENRLSRVRAALASAGPSGQSALNIP
ncbi:MAG: DUF2254 domain-containing protein [Betaproteobacteria bacterium HGW-Betaproteobacteria-10]|nr:MAG: DUF2254 domain-containing protein [Betaproteobacteria bacterium HGW-Betaproteobacteria-10]